ncbi:F-actin capping [Cryptosporidium bovis]|uniref:F-actin capping n=1 Tax=Cryptosporidium bovis TaxID=310047 RepID=UPI00351A7969|nr:F-actin capping [Cryptosporidium bovis]
MYRQNSGIYDENVVQALKIWSRCLPSFGNDVIKKLGVLFPTVHDEITSRIDTPLVLVLDREANKYYIGCNTNRIDGEKYRSPYTDKYYYSQGYLKNQDNEKEEDIKGNASTLDLGHLKILETEFHGVYENYCKYYSTIYDGSINSNILDHGILLSNVYCYDLSGDSFGTCFTMKHIINPFKVVNTDINNNDNDEFIYYLDIIHNVETVISHKLGISIYRISSVYYYGFNNKKNSIKYDGCKTNWLEKKYEFNTLKFTKNLKRTNTSLNINNVSSGLNNIALDRNSITIINNQTIYFHLLNIGKLIESIDNSVMKRIKNVYIDNLINISKELRK